MKSYMLLLFILYVVPIFCKMVYIVVYFHPWKESWIYVLIGKLHTKIMQEKHDVPMVAHLGERTTIVAIGKRFY
jgi:hypothetical protein